MTGEIAAIVCAVFFAFCSLAFAAAGRMVGSLVVNQLRILLATAFLFGLHLACFGSLWPTAMPAPQAWLLALSGVIGLALGDLCYFHSLAVVGPRLGTLLMATFPIFVVLGEGTLRGRWPGLGESGAMAAIVAGVMLVLTARAGRGAWQPPPGAHIGLAVLAGVLGAVGQGGGLVLAKLAQDAAGDAPAPSLSVTLVRMVAGLLAMAGISLLWRPRAGSRRRLSARAVSLIAVGVVFGPTLGVWLSMVALEHADAGPAAVLIALTPVLMLPITWSAYGERPALRAVCGTGIAFVGTAVLLWGRG